LELFGEEHNIRPGWVTLGNAIVNSNFDSQKYNDHFKKGTLLPVPKDIDDLRPKSPPRPPRPSFS
jgi:hypothetical protein